MKRIDLNKDFIDMMNKIIEQNQIILDMNKEIIKALNIPIYYIPEPRISINNKED